MPTFLLEQTVDASMRDVFDAATDMESLQKAVPELLRSVRIRSVRGNVSIIEERLMIAGRELVLMTKHVVNRPHSHDVFVVGGDAKGSMISERFSEKDGRTRIIVKADLKLHGMHGITGLFKKDRIRDDYACVIDGINTVIRSQRT